MRQFVLFKGYGDVSVKNRVFGSFFVLLGAGIVGTIFGLVSFKIMEEQEQLMNQRMTSLALKFNKLLKERKIKKAHSKRNIEMELQSDENVNFMYDTDENSGKSSSYKSIKRTVKQTVKQVFRLKSNKNKNFDEMSELTLAVYEEEILDIKVGAILNILMFFITLFTGALAMSVLEGWSFNDAVYWVRE